MSGVCRAASACVAVTCASCMCWVLGARAVLAAALALGLAALAWQCLLAPRRHRVPCGVLDIRNLAEEDEDPYPYLEMVLDFLERVCKQAQRDRVPLSVDPEAMSILVRLAREPSELPEHLRERAAALIAAVRSQGQPGL